MQQRDYFIIFTEIAPLSDEMTYFIFLYTFTILTPGKARVESMYCDSILEKVAMSDIKQLTFKGKGKGKGKGNVVPVLN
jgi:hypothetical protein